MNHLFENITRIVRDKRLSQKQIADAIGINQPGVSAFLSGDRENITYERLEQLADLFGMNVVDIFTYPEKWGPQQPDVPVMETQQLADELRHRIDTMRQQASVLEQALQTIERNRARIVP